MVNQNLLRKKIREVYSVEPNDLHIMPLTKWYKMLTGRLKQMPFLYVVPVAFLIVLVMYLVFGHLVVGLAGLLQYGS